MLPNYMNNAYVAEVVFTDAQGNWSSAAVPSGMVVHAAAMMNNANGTYRGNSIPHVAT
jgi:hypothetical protein